MDSPLQHFLLFLLLVTLNFTHLFASLEDEPVITKKKTDHSLKNQTSKAIPHPKFPSFPKNSTKILKSNYSYQNKTKKLNSTSVPDIKASILISSDLPVKTNKTSKSKEMKSHLGNVTKKANSKSKNQIPEDDDLVSEFRDLPAKFQETIVPDLQRLSRTSKSYINKYNKEFAKGFKPYVGNKYASTIASMVSFAFILIPLLLVSLIFNRIKAHFSLQKMLIFIQIYLAIYFSILCLSSLITGLEPLRFFYASSQSTYVCVQLLQTLSYVLYLLLLLMYLILVFSTETGLGTRLLSLGYTFVGFAVGLHYYMTVFHRAILRQLPKTSWKVHALYATSFIVICFLGKFDRGKKGYSEGGDDEGKKN